MADETSNAEIHDRLGGLGASMTAVQDGLSAMKAAVEKAADRADERERIADKKRALIHQRMDRMERDISDVKAEVSAVHDVAHGAKRVTDKVERWEQQGKGALFIIGIGGTAFGASLMLFFEGIARALKAKLGL